MRSVLFGTAVVTLVAALGAAPAMAFGPRPSGGNTWPGISQWVGHDPTSAETVAAANRNAAKPVPRYEWQYHYEGPHANWQGHWVLVRSVAAVRPRSGG